MPHGTMIQGSCILEYYLNRLVLSAEIWQTCFCKLLFKLRHTYLLIGTCRRINFSHRDYTRSGTDADEGSTFNVQRSCFTRFSDSWSCSPHRKFQWCLCDDAILSLLELKTHSFYF
ncbi:hypothetical protein C8Q75DRAFT_166692 [Abortiporus biennis]|nr:hypothetical protein C8Q75DRAFT_166692 [Abortiporus biennis]